MNDYKSTLYALERLRKTPVHRTCRDAFGSGFYTEPEGKFPWIGLLVLIFILGLI